jgi:hypothetical protein
MSGPGANGKGNGKVCPAIKYDKPHGRPEERVPCVREGKSIPRAMTFICLDCWDRLWDKGQDPDPKKRKRDEAA